jgi:cytoskeletal protein CcmA (bactofilin family)
MSPKYTEDDSLVNSIVGEGTRFRGHLELNGLLRIDGDFSGSIRTAGKVLIGKNGRADCTVHAETVVIGGALRGNVYATERVIVLSSAVVIGNVFAPRLIAEEGVLLNGTFAITAAAGKPVAEPTPREAKQGVLVGSKAEAEDQARSAGQDRQRRHTSEETV